LRAKKALQHTERLSAIVSIPELPNPVETG